MTTYLKKIPNTVSLLTIVILLSSILKNYFYYLSFGINIGEYTELSEYPLLFIRDLISYILLVFFVYLIPLIIVYTKFHFREKYGSDYFPFTTVKITSGICIITIIVTIIYFSIKDIPIDIKLPTIQLYIVALFAFFLLYVDKKIQYTFKYFSFISLFLILLFSVFSAYIEVYRVKSGKQNLQVSFNVNQDEIQSNNTFIYIGKTRNYIYIYDNKLQETSVYKFDDLNNFKVKKHLVAPLLNKGSKNP